MLIHENVKEHQSTSSITVIDYVLQGFLISFFMFPGCFESLESSNLKLKLMLLVVFPPWPELNLRSWFVCQLRSISRLLRCSHVFKYDLWFFLLTFLSYKGFIFQSIIFQSVPPHFYLIWLAAPVEELLQPKDPSSWFWPGDLDIFFHHLDGKVKRWKREESMTSKVTNQSNFWSNLQTHESKSQ